jgi:hypothetical protein
MDVKTPKTICQLAAIFCLLLPIVTCLPTDDVSANELEQVQRTRDDERRATWLETRNLEENFKELVYLSIQELASEGLINPDVITNQAPSADKRGRHQGFCFRKTKSGRFLPYICWKGEGDHEEK